MSKRELFSYVGNFPSCITGFEIVEVRPVGRRDELVNLVGQCGKTRWISVKFFEKNYTLCTEIVDVEDIDCTGNTNYLYIGDDDRRQKEVVTVGVPFDTIDKGEYTQVILTHRSGACYATKKDIKENYLEMTVKPKYETTLEQDHCKDNHYNFEYKLTPEDIEKGSIRVDPYWISMQWKVGEKDPSGCAFHMLKGIARLFTKEGNTKEREVDSFYKTAKRMKEIYFG